MGPDPTRVDGIAQDRHVIGRGAVVRAGASLASVALGTLESGALVAPVASEFCNITLSVYSRSTSASRCLCTAGLSITLLVFALALPQHEDLHH